MKKTQSHKKRLARFVTFFVILARSGSAIILPKEGPWKKNKRGGEESRTIVEIQRLDSFGDFSGGLCDTRHFFVCGRVVARAVDCDFVPDFFLPIGFFLFLAFGALIF